MARFELEMSTATADEMADELERIAGQVRGGFTSGYPFNGGHWFCETDPDVESEESEPFSDDSFEMRKRFAAPARV